MPNQIERDVFVTKNTIKNPIHYVRGTDLLPIVFHFRDFSIPSGVTARVFVAKPDGNPVYDSATIEGNDVTVDVTEQMFLVLGMTLMQISIFDGEKELVSFAQPVMVEQNLKAGDLPESTTDVSFLDDAIEQANQAVNTATMAASQAAQAVKNANQAIADANKAISDLNEQTASLNTNFALLSNNVSISQLQTTAKTLVGALNELNGNKLQKKCVYKNILPPEKIDDVLLSLHKSASLQEVYFAIIRCIDADDSESPLNGNLWLIIGFVSSISQENGYGSQLCISYSGVQIFIHQISNTNMGYISYKGEKL